MYVRIEDANGRPLGRTRLQALLDSADKAYWSRKSTNIDWYWRVATSAGMPVLKSKTTRSRVYQRAAWLLLKRVFSTNTINARLVSLNVSEQRALGLTPGAARIILNGLPSPLETVVE